MFKKIKFKAIHYSTLNNQNLYWYTYFQMNHHFEKAAVEFCYMTHPRFGSVRCMRSLRSIKKGEEIFTNYNYDRLDDNAPR